MIQQGTFLYSICAESELECAIDKNNNYVIMQHVIT